MGVLTPVGHSSARGDARETSGTAMPPPERESAGGQRNTSWMKRRSLRRHAGVFVVRNCLLIDMFIRAVLHVTSLIDTVVVWWTVWRGNGRSYGDGADDSLEGLSEGDLCFYWRGGLRHHRPSVYISLDQSSSHRVMSDEKKILKSRSAVSAAHAKSKALLFFIPL